MKTLLFSLLICVLVVPVMVASFLILTAIAVRVPDLYFSSISLALTFTILTMVWVPFGVSCGRRSVFVSFKEIGNR